MRGNSVRFGSLARAVSIAVGTGFLLGTLAWWGDRTGDLTSASVGGWAGAIAAIANLPTAWLLTAFLVGAASQRPAFGALSGALALATAVIAYYTAISVSGDRTGIDLQPATQTWVAVALLTGPLFGAAGALWRGGPKSARPLAVGLLAGAFVPFGLSLIEPILRYGQDFDAAHPAVVIALVHFAAALLLPLALLSSSGQRAQAIAATAIASVAYAFVIGVMGTVVDQSITRYSA